MVHQIVQERPSGALPMVSDLPGQMIAHANQIRECKGLDITECPIRLSVNADYEQTIDEYVEAMNELARHAQAHESIDTYAKKLYIGGKRKALEQLKILLTTYFSYNQMTSGKVDSRYDGFFASIMGIDEKSLASISDDVLLLTWNYDLQLPLMFKRYWYDARLEMAMEGLRLTTLESLLNVETIPKVIHLNGVVAGSYRGLMPVIPDGISRAEQVLRVLDLFVRNRDGLSGNGRLTMVRFAWEDEARIRQCLLRLAGIMDECEVLVAIGYSFPFFNRVIDRAVIGGMPKLKKVYLQSTEHGIKAVANAFKAIPLQNNVDIVLYDSVDKFMLPPEL